MASFHSRSNSFPSQTHPIMNDVGNHLDMLKASLATSTFSIRADLAGLVDLHDGINSLIRMPLVQQALAHEQSENWMSELLEGSLRLVDLYGFSRDIVRLTKESVQDLESAIRRKADGIDSYGASRKKINKMINKCVKNISNNSKRDSSTLPPVAKMLKEAESLDLSILKYVLVLLSGEKGKSNHIHWSLLSKRARTAVVGQETCPEDLCYLNIHKSRKSIDSKKILKHLKASETSVQEIEEGLEVLFRSLVKTRVSLLNALSSH
ncbi:hypothetical protein OROGR_032735 [Orobanche gracilis]